MGARGGVADAGRPRRRAERVGGPPSIQPFDSGAPATPARPATLLRGVNRRIAERAPMTDAAMACECPRRDCEEAMEGPLNLSRVVDARPVFFVLRPGNVYPLLERVLRRDGGYVVVERS